jgi:hypothetical protein
MKLTPVLGAVMALGLLAACDDKPECTQETIAAKSTELTTKIQEMAATDPAKVAALLPKLQEIATQAAAGGEEDLEASCAALDGLMAELAK